MVYDIFDIVEYARQGSLYDFIRRDQDVNSFQQILQWAKEIALGKLVGIILLLVDAAVFHHVESSFLTLQDLAMNFRRH